MEWALKSFDELTTAELYEILALRCEVFVVEQNCPYLDPDGLDLQSLHFFTRIDGEIAAYLRMLPAGFVYESPALGRFITSQKHRRTGLGRQALRAAIKTLFEQWDCDRLELSAQTYLLDFYRSEGIEPLGEPYLEDGIEHIHMVCYREKS